jgi:pyroglutamyl-peptidase
MAAPVPSAGEPAPPTLLLLVTGFSSFCGVERNPTESLIEYLRNNPPKQGLGPQTQLELGVLRVAAAQARAWCDGVLRDALRDGRRRVVALHLGVDARAGPPVVALERRAVNECGFRCADEDGEILDQSIPCCSAPPLGGSLETQLDVEALAAALRRRRDQRLGGAAAPSYDVSVSEDAGRFLCNYVYARSLDECRRAAAEQEGGGGGCAHALFVHVPPFEVMPEEAQREAVVDLILELAGMVS